MEARKTGRARSVHARLETDASRITVRARAATSIDAHIGRRLRAAREDRGMSLTDLAGLARIAPQQLQKYETARTRVSASRLYQLSALLGRPVFWFFEGH
jgi:ribosome-binding protein aMBF1 (putative translation factor)